MALGKKAPGQLIRLWELIYEWNKTIQILLRPQLFLCELMEFDAADCGVSVLFFTL